MSTDLEEGGDTQPEPTVDFEKSGVFYRENPEIGQRASSLLQERIGTKTALIDFEQELRDAAAKEILDRYPNEVVGMRRVWGKAPNYFYTFNPTKNLPSGLLIFLCAPGSRFEICLASHTNDLEEITEGFGMVKADKLVQNFEIMKVGLKQGGYVIVHIRSIFRVVDGVQILYAKQ